MTQTELRRQVREVSVQGNILAIRALLDVLLALINEPGPEAAGMRAALVRSVVEKAEELVDMTGCGGRTMRFIDLDDGAEYTIGRLTEADRLMPIGLNVFDTLKSTSTMNQPAICKHHAKTQRKG